jgi:hypothetical protein
MREKDLPRRNNVMSASVSAVSSRISRFAASSGLGSVLSIEPEHAAHLPLHVTHQLFLVMLRLERPPEKI